MLHEIPVLHARLITKKNNNKSFTKKSFIRSKEKYILFFICYTIMIIDKNPFCHVKLTIYIPILYIYTQWISNKDMKT